MLRKLKIFFIALAVVSALIWVFGLLMSIVIPIFGGVRADKIGAVAFSVSLFAEIFLQLVGWLSQRQFWNKGSKRTSFPIERKYGNRK